MSAPDVGTRDGSRHRDHDTRAQRRGIEIQHRDTSRHVPLELGSYLLPGACYALRIDDQHAYVVDGSAGLRVVDVSNPGEPAHASFVPP